MDFYVFSRLFDSAMQDNLHILRVGSPHMHDSHATEGRPYPSGGLREAWRLLTRLNTIPRRVALSRYDGVVVRYPKWSLFHSGLTRRYGDRLITEHHTNEEAEAKAIGPWAGRWLSMLERHAGPGILRAVRGIVAVTPEIRAVELQKAGPKPSIVVSNGISVQEIPFSGFRPFDGRLLRLLFVSSFYPSYRGLDRLLEGLIRYRGAVRVQLDLVGEVAPRYRRAIHAVNAGDHACVRLGGTVFDQPLEQHYGAAGLAVSTLGLHRMSMRQACPLKAREYMARGLPFIASYEDPDIPNDEPFTRRFPSDDSPIDIQRVVDFSREVSGKAGLSRRMREFAEQHLEWTVRLRCLYEFVGSLCRPPGP
ncbi:MAG: glycosyltransferase [Verrucomicrobia bacterium]|nr:glycosyltransferase [Verrucomicrobiota bacterium]